MQLTLNTTLAAEAGKDLTRAYVIMTGIVKDWDFDEQANSLITALEQQGMPQIGHPLSPSRPDLICTQHIVHPAPAQGYSYPNIARLRILFETPRLTGNTPIETFSIEDTTNLSGGTTQLLPGDLTPLKIYGKAANDTPETGPKDIATINFPVPMRSLVAYGLFANRPSITVQRTTRQVNDTEWQGFPVGFWLCTGPRVRWSNLDSYFRVAVGFSTKCEEDWSSYSILRGDDGKPWPVAESLTATLRDQPYEYGIRHQHDGILKVGPFRTANFPAIFGI